MSREANEALLTQFEEYLVLTHLSPSTVANYVADLRAFMRWGVEYAGPDFFLVSLTSDTIRAYRSHLFEDQRCAAATVNRRLQAMRKFCAFAVRAGLMTYNPATEIQPVQKGETSASPAPLTKEQIEGLLEASSSEQPSLARRDTAILMLMLHTGLRVNELVELGLNDVEFDHPGVHLTVKDGRQGGTRRIPLEGEVRHSLHEYLSVRPNVDGEDHLFLSREGRPLSIRSVQRIVSNRAQSAGLDSVSPQVLRRTFASRLLAATGDVALVSERLGHQNLTTTLRYISGSINKVENPQTAT